MSPNPRVLNAGDGFKLADQYVQLEGEVAAEPGRRTTLGHSLCPAVSAGWLNRRVFKQTSRSNQIPWALVQVVFQAITGTDLPHTRPSADEGFTMSDGSRALSINTEGAMELSFDLRTHDDSRGELPATSGLLFCCN